MAFVPALGLGNGIRSLGKVYVVAEFFSAAR
jgi:hypothetical protein